MKKQISLFLAVLLLMTLAVVPMLSALASAAIPYPTFKYVYTSNGKGLNFRDAPSLDGKKIGSIPYGTSVQLNEQVDSSWSSVFYDGTNGYVMSRYLVANQPGKNPAFEPTTDPEGISNDMFNGFQTTYYFASVRPSTPTGYVNMRWAPSLNASIHNRYHSDDVLTVISENSTWCQVLQTSGESNTVGGFMMKRFLTITNP